MTRFHLTATLLFLSAATVQADDTPAKPDVTPMLIQAAEEKYATEVAKAEAVVTKAEADLAKARKAAGEARLKAYKERLAEVTKTGDFDKALTVKARIEQLEKDPESEPAKPSKRPRPKDTVKFGGHTYALMREQVSWHIAKQRCVEMGGHLVVFDSEKEAAFIVDLCRKQHASPWVGATDEEAEGIWKWIDGSPAAFRSPHVSKVPNGSENYMIFDLSLGDWNDVGSGRSWYIAEWDH